jgi:hypothetical protein
MNERFKELADSATHYANGVCDADPNADWYETRDQKFGELIVKECILQVEKEYLPVLESTDAMTNRLWIGYVECGVHSVVAIQDHFGVKE